MFVRVASLSIRKFKACIYTFTSSCMQRRWTCVYPKPADRRDCHAQFIRPPGGVGFCGPCRRCVVLRQTSMISTTTAEWYSSILLLVCESWSSIRIQSDVFINLNLFSEKSRRSLCILLLFCEPWINENPIWCLYRYQLVLWKSTGSLCNNRILLANPLLPFLSRISIKSSSSPPLFCSLFSLTYPISLSFLISLTPLTQLSHQSSTMCGVKKILFCHSTHAAIEIYQHRHQSKLTCTSISTSKFIITMLSSTN